jgi:hypothetical protein
VIAEQTGDLSVDISSQSRRSNLGPAYEAGTVVVKPYAAPLLATGDELVADAVRFGRLLGMIYRAEDEDPGAPVLSPEIRLAVEGSAVAAGKSINRSVGFQPNAAQRKAIELWAMRVVREALHEWGWETVTDVSATQSYDFHCQSGPDELHVEVKGTTSSGSQLVLTRNEIDHIRANYPNTALAVVLNIKPGIEDADPSGGEIVFIYPWAIDDGLLSPISFVYMTPMDAAEPWIG